MLQLLQLGHGLCGRGRLARLVTEAPAPFRLIHHGPNPKEWPQHVQQEKADPTGGMDCVLVRVMAAMGDLGRNVVDRDDAVEQHDHHKKQQTERDIVQ